MLPYRDFTIRRTKWGLHVRVWINNSLHASWNRAYGWHIKIGRFVRARTY